DLPKGIDVIGAASDRLFEDRGIGRDASKPVFGDQPLELAAGEQAAAEIVEPDRLAKGLQGFDRVHVIWSLRKTFPINRRIAEVVLHEPLSSREQVAIRGSCMESGGFAVVTFHSERIISF